MIELKYLNNFSCFKKGFLLKDLQKRVLHWEKSLEKFIEIFSLIQLLV